MKTDEEYQVLQEKLTNLSNAAAMVLAASDHIKDGGGVFNSSLALLKAELRLK